MSELQILNRKGLADKAYIVGLNDKKVGLYAHTLLAAKQKAVEHFRPKKKEVHLVWVELAEE